LEGQRIVVLRVGEDKAGKDGDNLLKDSLLQIDLSLKMLFPGIP